MNVIVLGTSHFTLSCAKAIIDSQVRLSGLISMPAHAVPLNSADVSGFAREQVIPYHEIEDINSSASLKVLRSYAPDYIFSSWPKLLTKDVLDVPRWFVIGTHPTELPFNRGRHPLHWIIVQGISETKLSFFQVDESIDTGKILLQVPVVINRDDSIVDLIAKVNAAGYDGTQQLFRRLVENPAYEGVEQNHGLANYWRKRTPHDVTLDFRMSSDSVVRIVRSLMPPYACANLIFEKYVIKIRQAALPSIIMSPSELERIEPGKIISTDNRRIRIKAADGIVELEYVGQLPESLLRAKYLHPPSKYFSQWAEELSAQLI